MAVEVVERAEAAGPMADDMARSTFARALALIADAKVTVLHGVPTQYHLLMREEAFNPSRLTSLRAGVIAGSSVDEALVRRVRRWCDVLVAYGLTETGPVVTITRLADNDDRRLSTVGCALPIHNRFTEPFAVAHCDALDS